MKEKLAINGGTPIRKKLFPQYRVIGREETKAAIKVLKSGMLSKYLGSWGSHFNGGEEVTAFESEWAKYFKVKHAIAVNSASSAIQMAVGAIGISSGDEVIVTPYSMCISATAPLFYGGIPVFADIEPDYFCLDPKSIEERITPRTKAIIVVDLFGQPYDADAINAIAKKHKLFVIEDAAQAPGALYKGKYAGTLGDMGIFSLNYHKHIHTGEGGVLVTNNDELAKRARFIRNHAETIVEAAGVSDLNNLIGYNFRLTEIQAAIGREQLKKLKKLVETRIANCEYIAEEIAKIPGITAPKVRKGSVHAYYMHAFKYDDRQIGITRSIFLNAVKAELTPTKTREDEGPLVSWGYVKPLYLMPLFQKKSGFGRSHYPFNLPNGRSVSYKKGLCPVTEKMHEKEIFFQDMMHADIMKLDAKDVVEAFKKVYRLRAELKNIKK